MYYRDFKTIFIKKMIKYPSKLENLHFFVDFALKKAEENGFNALTLNHIELAVEECIVNIINYAFPETEGEIEMDCEISTDCICMIISDNGTAFNPLDKEDPNIDAPIEEREIGGLGIFLIKNMMDDVIYDRKNGKNILKLKQCLHEKIQKKE